MKKIFRKIVFFCVLIACSPVFADVNFNLFGNGNTFKLDPLTDGILFGTGTVLSGSDLLLDDVLKINRAEYKNETYDKDDVNGFDRIFMHQYSEAKDKAADYTLAVTMATPLVLLANKKEEWFTDAVMYAETLLIANGIKELTKLAVNRTRPYMYYDADTWPESDVDDGDFENSFPSGHTTMSFAAATFTSYTFCKYFPDSNWKYAVVAGSYGLALGTSTLRILSGNHFMTDVIAGAALGSAVGFLVPWIHTFNAKNNDVSVAFPGNGFYITFKL